jgi:hypothetical protein
MSTLADLLDNVREQIEADDDALNEARERLAFVRDKASTFNGALRTYRSGSLAAHTMNQPVTDGDGGLVLNRNYYPGLGPEGTGNEAPAEVVADLVAHLGPLIREVYPNAKVHQSKRGPKIHFHAPLWDGADPTVDLVLALTRKEGAGIWIPNLKDDDWEASDPEQHIRLFNDGAAAFRSTRRKIMRLAKAWNKQFTTPGASSFEMSVWAWGFVEPGMGVAKGLRTVFEEAASRLEADDATPDPAGVSPDLRLLIDAETMAVRLRTAASHMQGAVDAVDEDDIRSAVNGVFWNYIDAPATASLSAAATLLKKSAPVTAATLGVAVSATTAGASLARAYGGRLE